MNGFAWRAQIHTLPLIHYVHKKEKNEKRKYQFPGPGNDVWEAGRDWSLDPEPEDLGSHLGV